VTGSVCQLDKREPKAYSSVTPSWVYQLSTTCSVRSSFTLPKAVITRLPAYTNENLELFQMDQHFTSALHPGIHWLTGISGFCSLSVNVSQSEAPLFAWLERVLFQSLGLSRLLLITRLITQEFDNLIPRSQAYTWARLLGILSPSLTRFRIWRGSLCYNLTCILSPNGELRITTFTGGDLVEISWFGLGVHWLFC